MQSAKDALAAAEAEITSRQSALDFAKSDFERGQELMKTGFITKQVFEQRKRNFDSAVAAVASFTSQRDQAQSEIKNSEAEVERIESIIHDLTLVSPRNGRVQYQLARAGEVVAAGAPIVTILDLTDVYMTIFLPAADAGRLTVGDEARIVLDPDPGSRHSGQGQLRRRRRAVHAEDRRDQGRARQADVPHEAQGRSAGASGVLHPGEDRRSRHGLRAHQGRRRMAGRPQGQRPGPPKASDRRAGRSGRRPRARPDSGRQDARRQMTGEPIARVKDVSHRYGATVSLDDVSIDIPVAHHGRRDRAGRRRQVDAARADRRA